MSVVVIEEAVLRQLVAEEAARAIAPVLAALARPATEGAAEGTLGADAGLLTREDLAAMLNIDFRTLRRLELRGVIPPPLRIASRIVRWRRKVIENWLSKFERKELDAMAPGRLHVRAVNHHTAARARIQEPAG